MQQTAALNPLAKASDPSLTPNIARTNRRLKTALAFAACSLALAGISQTATAQTAGTYAMTPLLADSSAALPGVTVPNINPNFIDPWGVAGGNTLWINTNVTGLSYVSAINGVLNSGFSNNTPGTTTSVPAVPPAVSGSGPGQPTGIVQNTVTGGFLLSNNAQASFIFCTLDGTISGWNGALKSSGNLGLIAVNNNAQNAVYNGMALITNTSANYAGSYLLVANFGAGADVEIYNTTFKRVTALQGSFTDPSVPAGYAPYNVVSIGSQVYVTYMLRTTPPFAPNTGSYQEIFGTGNGFVSVFDLSGNFITRAIPTGGNLNAPWGVTVAPAGFGIYGGDLLVGNFADGLITAYNPTTYAYQGVVADVNGKPIAYPGLWAIFVSTATATATAPAAAPNSIYFTAGIANETHGLFGYIQSGPTSATAPQTYNLSTSTQSVSLGQGVSTSLNFSIAPSNGFSGMVSLSCSNLPVQATCSFSSPQVAVAANAPATGTLTIQTSSGTAGYARMTLAGFGGNKMLGLFAGVLMLLGTVITLRSRKRLGGITVIVLLGSLFACVALVSGCSSSMAGTPSTPEGTSKVAITATSGNISQTATISVIVN